MAYIRYHLHMAKALLLACDVSLVERLIDDGRWDITVGDHYPVTGRNVPDPRGWRLIVDDCQDHGEPKRGVQTLDADTAAAKGIPVIQVGDDYLQQATRARGIRFAGEKWHLESAVARNGQKYHDLEFNPRDARSVLLAEFVRTHGQQFDRMAWLARPRPGAEPQPDRELAALFEDSYRAPVLGLKRTLGFESLVLSNIAVKEWRVEALDYLITRVAPKLWPDLYAGLYQPNAVAKLLQERQTIAAEAAARVAELDERLRVEERFFAPFSNLLYAGEEPLLGLAERALRDVMDMQVTSAGVSGGLIAGRSGWKAYVEVASSPNRNAGLHEIDVLDRHFPVSRREAEGVSSRVLLFNGLYRRDDVERQRTPTFSRPMIGEAQRRRVGLIDTLNLLRAMERVHSGTMTPEGFMRRLEMPGLIEIEASR